MKKNLWKLKLFIKIFLVKKKSLMEKKMERDLQNGSSNKPYSNINQRDLKN